MNARLRKPAQVAGRSEGNDLTFAVLYRAKNADDPAADEMDVARLFPLGIDRLTAAVLQQCREVAQPVLLITVEQILRWPFDRAVEGRRVDYQAKIHRRHPPEWLALLRQPLNAGRGPKCK